jgi:uncharacterized repeat protein (TIGR03803 family)
MRRSSRNLYLRMIAAVLAFTMVTAIASLAQTKQTLFSFNTQAKGVFPNGGLILDSAGNLYGTTPYGGPACASYSGGCGVVYELSPSSGLWKETIVYAFSGPDGNSPSAGVVFDSHGNLYGTTTDGGTYNKGVVFELTKTSSGWQENVLYSFTGAADGGYPQDAVVLDSSGNVYGSTYSGGSDNQGTLFELTPGSGSSWTENVLLNFNNLHGTGPSALAFDASGNLYGTATNGVADSNHEKGTIYELTPTASGWQQSIFFTFYVIYKTGINPAHGVSFDGAGNLYGTTQGVVMQAGAGDVYEISPTQQETILKELQYQLTYGIRNVFTGPISVDASGNVYGSVYNQDQGAVVTYDGFVFRVGPAGAETLVFPSLEPADKIYPMGGLAIDSAGNVYGVTRNVSSNGVPAVFKITF